MAAITEIFLNRSAWR